MRLSIEPAGNRQTFASTMVRGKVLPVHIKPQMASEWCWAAIASALSGYFHGKFLSQFAVVQSFFGCHGDYTDDHRLISRCNRQALLSDALKRVDCYSHWSPGRPEYQRICTEIHQGHPVCLRIQWTTGDSHYVTITGVHPVSGEICVEDSIYGASTQKFAMFPLHYQNTGGVWRETYWTCNNKTTDTNR